MGTFKLVKLTDPVNNVYIPGGFLPVGEYDSESDYTVGNVASYGDETYIMYNDAPPGTLPTNTNYWQKFTQKGVPGNDGADGADGVGVPAGGSTGQILTKASNDDYATEWGTNIAQNTLLGMTDFPSTYLGQQGKTVVVNSGEDAVEFTDLPNPGTWGSINGTITEQTDLSSALGTKVTANGAITSATKTKITYDTKGLVTGGADATTADIADSEDKRYVTEAEKTKLSNLSGENTGDQDLTSLLALDQTTPQTIVAGAPIFDAGITSNNDIKIKSGFKLILDAD